VRDHCVRAGLAGQWTKTSAETDMVGVETAESDVAPDSSDERGERAAASLAAATEGAAVATASPAGRDEAGAAAASALAGSAQQACRWRSSGACGGASAVIVGGASEARACLWIGAGGGEERGVRRGGSRGEGDLQAVCSCVDVGGVRPRARPPPLQAGRRDCSCARSLPDHQLHNLQPSTSARGGDRAGAGPFGWGAAPPSCPHTAPHNPRGPRDNPLIERPSHG
jgi:hypothetical protein